MCARRPAPSRSGPAPPGQCRARPGVRRCRGGAGGVRRGRSRRRADLRQPAHRQLPDGAALGRRVLRRGGGFLHADFRQPGRPRAAHGAGGKLRAAAGEGPLRLPRRRRRLRAAQQSLSRAGRDPVGGEARRPSGEMDQRPLGILPHRLCGPRSGHHGAARADQRRPHHRLSRRSHRHLRRADRDLCAAEQRLSRRHHGLRHPADAHALPLGDDQHRADRAVPRRRPARGDAGAGAADRSRRRASSASTGCASARRTSSRRRSCPIAPPAGCSTTAATSPAT